MLWVAQVGLRAAMAQGLRGGRGAKPLVRQTAGLGPVGLGLEMLGFYRVPQSWASDGAAGRCGLGEGGRWCLGEMMP